MISFLKTSGVFALAVGLTAFGCSTRNHEEPGGYTMHQGPRATSVESDGQEVGTAAGEPQVASATVKPTQSNQSGEVVTGDWVHGRIAFPTGEQKTSALLVEQSLPSEIVAGRPFEHRIKVTNISSTKLDDVEVMEAVPASFKLSGEQPQATLKDGVVRHEVGDLAPGASKSIQVGGTVASGDRFNSCTSASYKSALCMTTPIVSPALKLAKVAPAEVMVCDTIPMKLTVTNSGSGTARSVRIDDTLPAGMTTEDGRNAVSFDVGTLSSGQSKDITFNAKVNKTGKYESKASAKAENGLAADSNAVATLVRQPILEITKTGPAKQYVGRPVSYDITVTNKGDAIAANTQLIDPVPAGAKFESASDGGRNGVNGVQWALGDLQPGASKKVSVTFNGIAAGTLKSQATAQAKCATAVTAAAATEFAGISAVLLECVDVTDPIEVGEQETYIITVTNQGSANDSNIKITVNLEDPMQFVSTSGATRATASAKTITFEPLATLAPKAKAEWRVIVKAIDAGNVRFKVDMTSDQLTRPVQESESSNFYK